MLARGSTPRDDSPAPIALQTLASTSSHPPPAKRPTTAAASPAPSEPPENNVVLHADLSSRPRLTISRHPVFVPLPDNPTYHTTDQLAPNRLGFRYVPAGVDPPGFRTIESIPTSYRISWEDRSPFLKVTTDGLGLLGEKGFRSARGNAPIREGKWYVEVTIEKGGGEISDFSLSNGAPSQQGAHVRLGWGRREASLNAPCGLDGYSYALRDKTGEKVTLSRPRPYGTPLRSGDVVGMYISLPPLRPASPSDPHDPAHLHRERIAIEFKGQEYFEALEYAQSKEMLALMDFSRKPDAAPASAPVAKKGATVKNVPERGSRGSSTTNEPEALRPLPTLPDSRIAFFVNGVPQGTAFRDIYDFRPLRPTDSARNKPEKRRREREGVRGHRPNPFDDGSLGYYPFISLFGEARVRLNPGPDFAFPPPDDIDATLDPAPSAEEEEEDVKRRRTWRPLCERYPEYMEEQWALDRVEAEELVQEIARRAAQDREDAKKKAERDRKRAQAAARRKAKKDNEARPFPSFAGLGVDAAASPAPTMTGGASTPGMQSRAPSEFGDEGETYGYSVYGEEGDDGDGSTFGDGYRSHSHSVFRRAPSEQDPDPWPMEEGD
ncbi:hypothetical protein OF83DRAFT_1163726 [Amylostereum chailletii]|nr:hypothetical protein OF83DRAFT_1163726 [Amylostereum chailletii]